MSHSASVFYSIFADSRLSAQAGLDLHFSFSSVWVMTSMRMRLLFSLSCVHVLVRYIGGEGGWGDDVHANAPFVFSFLCSRAGAVHRWGGGVG